MHSPQDLPAELRQRIYSYALITRQRDRLNTSRPFWTAPDFDFPAGGNNVQPYDITPGIVFASRFFLSDAGSIFFACNRFNVILDLPFSAFDTTLEQLVVMASLTYSRMVDLGITIDFWDLDGCEFCEKGARWYLGIRYHDGILRGNLSHHGNHDPNCIYHGPYMSEDDQLAAKHVYDIFWESLQLQNPRVGRTAMVFEQTGSTSSIRPKVISRSFETDLTMTTS